MIQLWQKEIETMERSKLEALQLERFKWSVKYTYDNVAYYRKKMDLCGIKPERIKTLSDVQYLPYTTKEDLQAQYPFGAMAQPQENISRIQGSSGTHGKPTIVGYTKKDLDNWTDLVARIIVAAGVTKEDVAQIAFGYGLFTGAFGLHQGLERVGAMVVPLSSGNTERQLMLMKDLHTTVLVATPSYAVYLAEQIEERNLKEKLKLRIGLLGSEPCSLEMKNLIEQKSGLFVTDNYGMSELLGPGVAGECMLRCGLHMAEDHFLPEIINPTTLERLPEGENGELVVTTLTKEGLPLIRYRTGDLTAIHYEPCTCGRTHARIDKIKARTDDMLVVKGINLFPSQIENAISGLEQLSPHYILTLYREGAMDQLELKIELASEGLDGEEVEKLRIRISNRIRFMIGLRMRIKLLPPKALERFSGKAKRVVDLR